jgi:hypothetical protein
MKTQLKQTLGVGFAYNIDSGIKFKEDKEIKIGNKYTEATVNQWFFLCIPKFSVQTSVLYGFRNMM